MPTPDRIAALLHALNGVRAVVLGDLLLDEYIWGEAERISPEAPVPVVRVTRQETRLGGAANVARQVAALGGVPLLVGPLGSDETGAEIARLWLAEGHDPAGFRIEPSRATPRKTRILAAGQQMLRIDREDRNPAETGIVEELRQALAAALSGAQVALFSDYQKGTFGSVGTPTLVEAARAGGVPLLANAKPASAAWFQGVGLQTLNRGEALGLVPVTDRQTPLDELGDPLRAQLGVESLLITRGPEGMTLFGEAGHLHIPAVVSEVFDVTGAGDTVLATLGLALGAGLSPEEACLLATYAAGVVVRKVGVAVATPSEVRELAGSHPVEPRWDRAGR